MPQVGIIGVDPGVTTGLAWGRYNPELRDRSTLWKALARGRGVGCDQVVVAGDIMASGLAVCIAVNHILNDWALAGLGVDDVLIVIEDFIANPEKVRGGTARDKLAPVGIGFLLAGVVTGRGYGRQVRFVTPSQGKNKANDNRLKEWAKLTNGRAGWVKGRTHTRDAHRMVAVGLELVP